MRYRRRFSPGFRASRGRPTDAGHPYRGGFDVRARTCRDRSQRGGEMPKGGASFRPTGSGLAVAALGWLGWWVFWGSFPLGFSVLGVFFSSDRATSFGEVAEDYDLWRPSYPCAAVDWLAPAAPARVADVGAGTGKLTELLLARGLEVDSVEPDQRMLAVLGRNNPSARRRHSSSTRIPVEDGALDAVLVADAWHWFDPEPTITEVRRVLKPGGWLGLVWNVAAEPIESWERALADDSIS